MSKWYKACYSFKEVRSMLDDDVETVDRCVEIIEAIEDCCEQIMDNETNWDFYEDFADLKAEIHDEVESISEMSYDEIDYKDCQNMVNYYLGELYDLCDVARVWLAI